MEISFDEVRTRHHLSGAYLFYRLDNGLYEKYLIVGMDKVKETLTIRKVR